MSYQVPADLAKKHGISLKTVYNYLSKYPQNIRTEKRFWKKFIHSEDFENLYLQSVQSVQNPYNGNHKQTAFEQSPKWFWSNAESNETFVTTVTKELQNHTPQDQENSNKKQDWIDIESTNPALQKVQSERDQLQQYNLVLQEQVSKFALLEIEQRNEKKEWIQKHDQVQEQLQSQQQQFYRRQIRNTKKLYLFVGLCIALSLALSALLWLRFHS